MTRSFFSVLSLLGITLVGCDGSQACNSCNQSSGTDQDQTCATCNDDTGDPPAMGSFTAPQVLLPDGSLEDCTSNLISANTDYTVLSGTTQDVAADDYDLTFGDFALASDSSDSLPVHTASDGSHWIAPAQTTSVEADQATTPEAQAMSRYVGGETWTCNEEGSTNSNTAQTVVVSYVQDEGGLLIGINGGKWGIDGDTLFNPYSSEECAEMYGSFINATQLTYYAQCAEGDRGHTTDCWNGEFEDKPDTW